jgi:type VI secretion system protein ImpA
MTVLDVASLARPLSPDEPGGPDLDLEGDPDHLNFMARVEGALPTSFASFDRASIDFKTEIAAAIALLQKTRDLRVLVLLVKLQVLDRRLEGFASALHLCAELLETMWEGVHPKAMDGDFGFRLGVLLALDDMPHIVLPLQSTPLFEVRRGGRITLRQHLIASGAAQPRDGEQTLTAQQIATALADLDADGLAAAIVPVDSMLESVSRMIAAWAKGGMSSGPLAIEKLKGMIEAQRQFLYEEVRRRDPGAAPAEEDSESGEADAGTSDLKGVRTRAEAEAALLGLARYLSRAEPSSLALMLVRQARQLSRMSFIDTVRLLLPDYSSSANVRFGGEPGFSLPLDRIGEAPVGEDETAEEAETADAGADPPDAWAAHGSGEADSAEGDAGAAESGDGGTEIPDESALRHRPVQEAFYNVRSRNHANELIGQVATFFRTAEPSSPIPLVLDRARGSSGRDFLALLQDVMPANALRLPRDE